MLTPVDVQNKVFKGGIGFDKRDVEVFMADLASDYEQLYRSNVELKDKVATLDESLQHYRSIEESMQKALTLSEKTAEETVNAANDKARQINTEAEKKAEALLEDAKNELEETKNEIFRLQQQHAKFKEQFTHILQSQLKMMDGEVIDIDLGDFEGMPYNSGGSGGFGGEGGLGGGLGGGGGYVGSNSFDEGGYERSNQEPAFNRGSSLNMDPFGDAMSGGGRFSKQTGGAYNGKSGGNSRSNKKTGTAQKETKSSLNVKNSKDTKIKKNFTASAAQPAKETSGQSDVNTAPKAESKPTPEPQQKPVPESNVQPEKAAPKAEAPKAAPQPKPVPPTKEAEEQVSGEVEDKINEATMLDSEDNYSTGFDFVSEDIDDEEAAITGEVEDKINEATMLDSEDNYSEGFDFVVGNEEAEEIPTISSDSPSLQGVAGVFGEGDASSSGGGLNIDPFGAGADDDVFVGDVEDNHKPSNLIGNSDDDDEGFNFM